jgi:hypothetical protein
MLYTLPVPAQLFGVQRCAVRFLLYVYSPFGGFIPGFPAFPALARRAPTHYNEIVKIVFRNFHAKFMGSPLR